MLSHIGICVIDVLVSAVGAMLTVDPLRKEKKTHDEERMKDFKHLICSVNLYIRSDIYFIRMRKFALFFFSLSLYLSLFCFEINTFSQFKI